MTRAILLRPNVGFEADMNLDERPHQDLDAMEESKVDYLVASSLGVFRI